MFSLNNPPVPLITVALLLCSNIFMTFAWYGHLKYRSSPILAVILISWAIAFFEYCLQVPANRIGYGYFSTVELKTIQEVISLSVFLMFSVLYLGGKGALELCGRLCPDDCRHGPYF